MRLGVHLGSCLPLTSFLTGVCRRLRHGPKPVAGIKRTESRDLSSIRSESDTGYDVRKGLAGDERQRNRLENDVRMSKFNKLMPLCTEYLEVICDYINLNRV